MNSNSRYMNKEIRINTEKAADNSTARIKETSFQLPGGIKVTGLEAQIALKLLHAKHDASLTVHDLALGILGDRSMDTEDKIIFGFTRLNLKTIGSRFKICKVEKPETSQAKDRKRKYYAMILPEGERVEPKPKKERKQTDRKQPVAYMTFARDVEVTASQEEQKLFKIINANSKKEAEKNAEDFSKSFGDVSPKMAVGLLRSVVLKNIALGNITGRREEVLKKNLEKAKMLFERVSSRYTKRIGIRRQLYF